MLLKGDEIAKDQAAGIEWLRKSARGGESRAQQILAENNVQW
jgi:hypothetical protein